MMAIADPSRPMSEDLLYAPGGFAWWYLDLVDGEGNGCVLIWSFGLPFLPGRESAARAGRGELPRARPSLNIAVYRSGKPALYVLQEHAAADARWVRGAVDAPTVVQLGRSTLHTGLSAGERRVEMDLDVDLPRGGRLTGTVSLRGAGCVVDGAGHDPHHQWAPLCTAAMGRAELAVDGRALLSMRGRGYHDRNGSTASLSDLGIRHWLWGRAPFGEAERIWYVLWPHRGAPEAWGLQVAPTGQVQIVPDLRVAVRGPRVGVFGLPWWRGLDLSAGGAPWLRIAHEHTVDLGFFYGRWLAAVHGPNGERALGVAEAVRPGRVDAWWNRWLVRMAVHRAHGPNSPFLPLFSGVRGRPAPIEAAS